MERLTPIVDSRYERKDLCAFPTLKALYRFALSHVQKYRARELAATWRRIKEYARLRLTEERFLKEYLWCVYVAGFSAQTVSKKYDELLKAHKVLDVRGAFYPITQRELLPKTYCRAPLKIIRNRAKCEAIRRTRLLILEKGWVAFEKEFLDRRSPESLQRLPFIGPILACHLARNLGNTEVCKPDVHLVRLAKHYGFGSVQLMCESLGRPAGKVDLILWYTSADNRTR